jgi:hypothetical protein
MQTLEALLALADATTLDMVRDLIGRENLALLIAKSVLSQTSESLRPAKVANLFEITPRAASDRIANAAVREVVKGNLLPS